MPSFSLSGAVPTAMQALWLLAGASDLLSTHAPDGTYLYVSPASETLLGYEPEELVGKSGFQFMHPDDIGPTQAAVRDALHAEREDLLLTYRYFRRDGSLIWIEAHAKVVRDPLTGRAEEYYFVSRDVTRRVLAEQELQEQKQLLEALFDHSPAGISILAGIRDPATGELVGLRIVRRNLRAAQMLGQPAGVAGPNVTVLSLYPNLGQTPVYAGFLSVLLTGQPYEARYPIRADGLDGTYHFIASPLGDDRVAVTFLSLAPFDPPGAEYSI